MRPYSNFLKKVSAIFRASAILLVLFTTHANGAGLLIADGGFGGVLEIKEHEVQVTINNGVAVTHVTQVFHNTENRQVEALYTFPVPKGASVANFSMWINGKEMIGEVLEKQRAREIYNSYKQTRKDPGLLEQKDYKTFEMRIFPINAGADQKVQISYYQELDVDHDRAVYVYPLATVTRRDAAAKVTGKFAMNMEIKSAIPIVKVESPSHGDQFVTADHSENFKQISMEAVGGSLASDMVVSFDLARPKTGIDLITSHQGGEDGYFLMTLATGKELEGLNTGMDYVFVMDISGSMEHDGKLVMSKNSVEAFITELGKEDNFEILTFNISVNALFSGLRPASDEMKQQAENFMRTKRAAGSTVLAPAMTAAYKYAAPDRTLNVVILSDGMTEQSERQTLIQLIASRPKNTRVFCIGIGNEINRPLLDQMAEDSGGLAAYISHGDNFQKQAKAFRRKLMRPVATDLTIAIAGVKTYDIEPLKIPNLYHGSPLRIYGRYSGSGEANVTLNGSVQGVELKQSVKLRFPDQDADNPEIERMWAWKRINQLLKEADRKGSRNDVTDQIVRLGEDYSIVTEYTSFLVLENDAEYQRWKIEKRNSRRLERDRDAQSRRKTQAAAIRNKVNDAVGPEAGQKQATQPITVENIPAAKPAPSQPAKQMANAKPEKRSDQSSDFQVAPRRSGGGSGPVGPLFVAVAWWMKRKRMKR